jgi:hypothetical protein
MIQSSGKGCGMQKVGLSYEEFIKGISAVGYRWSPGDMTWKLGNEIISDEALRNFIATWPNLTVSALDLLKRFKRGFAVNITPKPDRVIVSLTLPGQESNQSPPENVNPQQIQMARELHALVASWQIGVPFERALQRITEANPTGVIGSSWIRVAKNLLREHQTAVLQNRKLVQDGNDLLKSALSPDDTEE